MVRTAAPFLEQEFANRKRKPLPQPVEAPVSTGTLETAAQYRLRPDIEYHRLAEQILASQDWKTVPGLTGRLRDRQLGRLMNRVLKSEGGQNGAPRPTEP